MKVKVWNNIVQLSKERGIDTLVIINAIKESLKVAASKYFIHNEEIFVTFKPEKGELRVYSVKTVMKTPENLASEISLEDAKDIDPKAKIGGTVEVDLPTETLGRISAQSAKKVIIQKVRDAEQEKIYDQFASRLGNLVTGVLRRFEANKNMILELDKIEVLFPKQEMLPNESFIRGDRVKAVIKQVYKEATGAQVIVSRTDNRFLAKLLELETPEISNGSIEIKDIVRQPGERAKVAVFSKEKDIDPVGACIGMKGNRILAISQELQGEKIDIIGWSDNNLDYAKAALSPAKVERVFVRNTGERMLQAVVAKDQLSLAIGKKGMNVRLASILVGCRIEINQM
ncbi:MAG: transcription termination factor NusA [Candidatus Aminicenantes bacterium]|nr:transcription termination factor NusA [Candidatus Aminicenantes bacterium]